MATEPVPSDTDEAGQREVLRHFGRDLLDIAPRIMRLETHRLAALRTPLTHRQYRILQRVGEGATSSTIISRRANVSLAAISESVDALTRRGLLTREPDPNDRRANLLGLTAEGRRALKAAEAALDQLSLDLADGISARTMSGALRALDRVNDNVRSQHETLEVPPTSRPARVPD